MRTRLLPRFTFTLVFAAVCACAASGALHGQATDRERTLFVSAVDGKGEPVEDLAVRDFIVTEDGRRREVLRVTPATEPIDIAVLFDNSTASESKILSLREALTNFVSKMAGQNQIAVIGLASRPTIHVDYTSDQKRLTDATGRIFAQSNSGMTLLDGLFEVSAGLARRTAARAVLVPVITNGPELSTKFSRDAIDAVTRAGAAIHAFTIGELPMTSDLDRERLIVMSTGTRASGGQHVVLLSELGLNLALQRLARELSSQYKVVYNSPEEFLQPEKVAVASARAGITMRGTPLRRQNRGA
jgi:VWFA-related protein